MQSAGHLKGEKLIHNVFIKKSGYVKYEWVVEIDVEGDNIWETNSLSLDGTGPFGLGSIRAINCRGLSCSPICRAETES